MKEHNLEEKLGKLQADIDLFSYVASHDLHNPVGAILERCNSLTAHCSNSSDEATLEQIKSIAYEANNMNKLLDAIMDYMRVDSGSGKKRPFSSKESLDRALDSLSEIMSASNAEISIPDEMPEIYGRRIQFSKVFLNLIENAIKFCSRGEKPKISINVEDKDNFWEFTVSDNGIGVAEEGRDIIFMLFQKEEKARGYPSIGSGLAIAKKIIEFHGGEMWLDTSYEGGSSFHFTVPKNQEESA